MWLLFYWELIGDHLFTVVLYFFFSISKLPISWGITFVVLFPKMIIHSLLTISILFFLCNVSYKIISKSLLLVLSW